MRPDFMPRPLFVIPACLALLAGAVLIRPVVAQTPDFVFLDVVAGEEGAEPLTMPPCRCTGPSPIPTV